MGPTWGLLVLAPQSGLCCEESTLLPGLEPKGKEDALVLDQKQEGLECSSVFREPGRHWFFYVKLTRRSGYHDPLDHTSCCPWGGGCTPLHPQGTMFLFPSRCPFSSLTQSSLSCDTPGACWHGTLVLRLMSPRGCAFPETALTFLHFTLFSPFCVWRDPNCRVIGLWDGRHPHPH